jgi:hypothetical protein
MGNWQGMQEALGKEEKLSIGKRRNRQESRRLIFNMIVSSIIEQFIDY